MTISLTTCLHRVGNEGNFNSIEGGRKPGCLSGSDKTKKLNKNERIEKKEKKNTIHSEPRKKNEKKWRLQSEGVCIPFLSPVLFKKKREKKKRNGKNAGLPTAFLYTLCFFFLLFLKEGGNTQNHRPQRPPPFSLCCLFRLVKGNQEDFRGVEWGNGNKRNIQFFPFFQTFLFLFF